MEPIVYYIYKMFFKHSNLLHIKGNDIGFDDEIAHAIEDRIHERALEYISNGIGDAELIAKLALLTKNLDFARWTA